MQMVSLADSINTCIVELLWMPQLVWFHQTHSLVFHMLLDMLLCIFCQDVSNRMLHSSLLQDWFVAA